MTASSNPAAAPRRSLVLITDDEVAIRRLVGRIVAEFDLVPVPAENETVALNAVRVHRAELACAIVGRIRPSMNAIMAANAIHAAAPELPLILMGSTLPSPAFPGQPALGLFGFLLKPFSIADLRGMLLRLTQRGP
jgi:DNA-binding NtrC family response regulator